MDEVDAGDDDQKNTDEEKGRAILFVEIAIITGMEMDVGQRLELELPYFEVFTFEIFCYKTGEGFVDPGGCDGRFEPDETQTAGIDVAPAAVTGKPAILVFEVVIGQIYFLYATCIRGGIFQDAGDGKIDPVIQADSFPDGRRIAKIFLSNGLGN